MHPALCVDEILDVIFRDPTLHSQLDERASSRTPSPERVYRKHPLLALALTCKTLHEPAIRALWWRIDGLDRLVRTMPSDVIKVLVPRSQRPKATIEDPENEWAGREENMVLERFGGTWPAGRCIVRLFSHCTSSRFKKIFRQIFKKAPTEQDWKIFERFARYVREFGRPDGPQDKFRLEDDIHQALRTRYSRPEAPILPHLRTLSCNGCKQLRYANLLLPRHLHASLASLSVHGACSSCTLAFIEDAKHLSSVVSLRHIHLGTHYIPQDLYLSFSDFLMACSSSRLKSLHVSGVPMTLDAMRLALQWPALEEFTARVSSFDIKKALDQEPRPLLRKFQVESEVFAEGSEAGGRSENDFYSELVERLRAPGLVDFKFEGGEPPLAHDIERLLKAFAESESFADETQGWRAPCIRLLPARHRISQLPTPLPNTRICTFSNALYVLCQPSLTNPTRSRFSQLRMLDLYETSVDMTDAELGILATALPYLRTLIFSARSYGREKSRTTLVGLWLLAKRCKDLETISLLIDAALDWEVFEALTGFTDGAADKLDARWEQLAQGRNNTLHALYVGESTIQDEDLVTNFLKLVFPGIVNLCYTNSREMTGDMKRWRAVRHQLG